MEGQIEGKKINNKKITAVIIGVLIIVIFFGVIGYRQYENNKSFNNNVKKGDKLFKAEMYDDAIISYKAAIHYKKSSKVKHKIKLSKELKRSLNNYNKANKSFESKNFIDAYSFYDNVIAKDIKRYKLAQTKMKESSKLYANNELSMAYDYAKKKNYKKAILSVKAILAAEDILGFEYDNTNIHKLIKQWKSDLNKEIARQNKLEAEKRLREIEIKNQQKIIRVRNLIKINNIYSSQPNSAGGVDLHIEWRNNSKKTIKYICFEVNPYNAVGDVVRDEINDSSLFRGQETGPIYSGESFGEGRLWSCAWYNNTITDVKLAGIEIQYMDGTTENIDEDYVKYVQ